MVTKSGLPSVALEDFKRTKIIATIGPSTDSLEAIEKLIKNGANGIRLNFSHGTHEEKERHIKWIREVAKKTGKPIAIIQDLQGPKIRLGDFEETVAVSKGEIIGIKYNADYKKTGYFPTQYDLSKKAKRGQKLLLNDGKLVTTIKTIKDGALYLRAENSGLIVKRKGINLPETDFAGDVITVKDREDLAFGSTKDIDYVAMSFIQTADDINSLRKILANLGSTARIIAKIETESAVKNLEEIVEVADAVMVARGDLANEVSAESVPVIQRRIIHIGKNYAKPTIVATQMLASMTEQPEPTRAEVSDIATAVILGSDAIMLSDETAVGKYPDKAVRVMREVITYTQTNEDILYQKLKFKNLSMQQAICKAIIKMANDVSAKAIVSETKSGATALQIAAFRSDVPQIAVTSSSRVAQQLAIVFGVQSYVMPESAIMATKLSNWLQRNKIMKKGDVIVTASGKHPGVVGTTDTIKIRMLE